MNEARKQPDRRKKIEDAAFVFRYLRPYRLPFCAAILSLVASTSLGLCFPYLTGVLLDSGFSGDKTAAALTINRTAILLLATLAAQAVFSFFSTSWFYACGEKALTDLRRETFSRLIGMPMAFFSQRRIGELSSRLTNDLTLLQDTLTMTVQQTLRQSLLLTGGIFMVAWTSLRLSGLMISTFPVLVLVGIVYGRYIRRHAREAQDRLAEAGTVVDESLQGIANVKAFGNERFEFSRYSRHLDSFLRVILRTAVLRASMVSFIIFGVFGSIVLVFWYGAHLMLAGGLTFGELTRFVLYTTFVGGSVASFAEVAGQVQKTLGATERVRELLSESPEIDSRAPAPAVAAPRFQGTVRFDDVSFRYPSRKEIPVLQNLTIEAAAGESIALVGTSGAGKSTIVSLLLRFYEPESGRILVDGRPAAGFTLAELRSNLAIVPQEVILLGGSVRENILYGKPSASPEEVVAASRLAACHEFIERFPDGYETVVGDRGIKLSGGQRQRIAIARALLKDPAILILDEATSSLDSESEQLIQKALGVLLQNRTAIIIAHRLSTIRRVDRIYVIEHGRVVETGTHDELFAKPDGTYRRLAELQFLDPDFKTEELHPPGLEPGTN
jgi:ABC transporter fused permease/ATP-binding protein